MSILFDALQKAARDYRRQTSPVIVSLSHLTDAPLYRQRKAVYVVAAALLFGLVLGNVMTGGAVANEKPKAKTVAVTSEAKIPALPKSSRKTEMDEPSGITLSLDDNDTPVKTSTQKNKPEPRVVVEETKPAEDDKGPLAEAAAAAKDKDWNRALALYSAALKKNKNDKDALLGKIYVLEQRGSDEDLETLDDMADKHAKEPTLHAARARILIRQNDTVEALAAWGRAVQLNPKNKDYRLGLAILNDRLGHDAEALRLYKEVPGKMSAEVKQRVAFLKTRLSQAQASNSESSSTEE